MTRRQPLPRLWLMTDERQGDGLWRALERLPRGAGIVFRHYRLPRGERRRLFERVRRIARVRGLTLIVAGSPLPGGDGTHGRPGRGLRTASAHNLRELKVAERSGADLVFLDLADEKPIALGKADRSAQPARDMRRRQPDTQSPSLWLLAPTERRNAVAQRCIGGDGQVEAVAEPVGVDTQQRSVEPDHRTAR